MNQILNTSMLHYMFHLESDEMKKNGMTLVEIILAVALISLVMIFVFNMLVDLRQEETFSSYKSSDQINRSIISKRIQDDLLNRGLERIENGNGTCYNNSTFCNKVNLIYKDGTIGKISVEEHYFSYQFCNTVSNCESVERWNLSSASYKNNYIYCFNYGVNIPNGSNGNYYVQLIFPVNLSDNALESQIIFDIEVLYFSNSNLDFENVSNWQNNFNKNLNGATNLCTTLDEARK